MSYLFIFLTIMLTVYGQIIVKWRFSQLEPIPADVYEKIIFLFKMYLDPWILSGLFAAFLASFSWMAAVSKLDLSIAYPFTSLSFVLVFVFSSVFLNEPIQKNQIIGLLFIIAGIIISSKNGNWF